MSALPDSCAVGPGGDGIGFEALPARATACGEPGALSTTVIVAAFAPSEVGAKLAFTEQLAPGARPVRQVEPLKPKSPASAPPRAGAELKIKSASPVFVSVTTWGSPGEPIRR